PGIVVLTTCNLEHRVSPALCQRLFPEQQQIKKLKKYSKKSHYPRGSPGDQSLTKKPEDSGFEIAQLAKRSAIQRMLEMAGNFFAVLRPRSDFEPVPGHGAQALQWTLFRHTRVLNEICS
ncbi:MAG: hypothetical protein OIF58_08505, partial [Cohaesibacter sp.]|nr:hypothetical protein [Cohaesibacter sp.]